MGSPLNGTHDRQGVTFVNASTSALPREHEVESKISKVRTFGRNARVACAALFGFGLVEGVGALFLVALGPKLPTPQLKVWALLVTGVLSGIALSAMYQLYRLFGDLAAGAIFTPENVRRVRHVGLLCLLWALLGIVIPVASASLVALGYIDAWGPFKSEPVFSQWLSPFVAAGFILLVSWIIDVGLYEKDHAEALQRDADLVI
jgi:hypothetical protein